MVYSYYRAVQDLFDVSDYVWALAGNKEVKFWMLPEQAVLRIAGLSDCKGRCSAARGESGPADRMSGGWSRMVI